MTAFTPWCEPSARQGSIDCATHNRTRAARSFAPHGVGNFWLVRDWPTAIIIALSAVLNTRQQVRF
ncbi:hypothetical protein BZM26_35570 [Paraburkholderia strydomiana]|nr:hypothetical protein BZM26_35570 [Paraburkholderia strydomiana]